MESSFLTRDQHSAGGHPREVRWTVTPSEGKDSDSSDSTCSVENFGIFISFFALSPTSVVVVDFIGTRKSN